MTSTIRTLQSQIDQVREERDRLHTELQKSIFREEELETALKEAQEIIGNNISLITSSNKIEVLNSIQKVLQQRDKISFIGNLWEYKGEQYKKFSDIPMIEPNQIVEW